MTDEQNIDEKFKEISENVDKFSSILEKFGLDLITKLGQTNLKLNKLTDKINDLSQATLDVKSLKPQLNTVIESQDQLKNEVQLIQNLIKNIKSFNSSDDNEEHEVERDLIATEKKLSIIQRFDSLKEEISSETNPKNVIKSLDKIKEDIFEYTGGHRILYEISQVINKINTVKSLSDPFDKQDPNATPLKRYLEEKITFWINKLNLKD